MISVSRYIPYVLIGKLSRDFIISQGGVTLNNVPGGHLFFAAAGLHHWEKNPGLVSRIGPQYPEEWLVKFRSFGMDTQGIKRVDVPIEQRSFISYMENGQKDRVNMFSSYCNAGLPFPRDLLGYNLPIQQEDSLTVRGEDTIIARDIPPEYLEARCIHLCPMDYLTHNLLPQLFMRNEQKTITLEAGRGYMVPRFFDLVQGIIHNLDTFITTETKLRRLFSEKHHITDLWEMAEILVNWGVENVIIRRKDRVTLLLPHTDKKRYTLPPYKNKVVNLTGETSAFCGGYIAGLSQTYDPVRALIFGAAAASFVCESADPFTSMDILPGLLEARMDVLENKIEKQ